MANPVQTEIIQYNDNNAICPLAFGSNITAGNMICGAVSWVDTNNGVLNSVTDTLGNTYTLLNNSTSTYSGGVYTAQFYALSPSGGANTVQANFSVSAFGLRQMVLAEVEGRHASSPLDGNDANAQLNQAPGTDVLTSTDITTTANGDYLFGWCLGFEGTAVLTAGTTGFTLREGTGLNRGCEDQIQASAGTIAATFTLAVSNNYCVTGIMAFKPAAGGTDARKLVRTFLG